MNGSTHALERSVELALSIGLALSMLLLLGGLLAGNEAAERSGVLLLMVTPVIRVTIVTVGLAHRRDWLFAALSLFVLGVLGSGMLVALSMAP